MRILVRRCEHSFEDLRARLAEHESPVESERRGWIVVDVIDSDAGPFMNALNLEGYDACPEGPPQDLELHPDPFTT